MTTQMSMRGDKDPPSGNGVSVSWGRRRGATPSGGMGDGGRGMGRGDEGRKLPGRQAAGVTLPANPSRNALCSCGVGCSAAQCGAGAGAAVWQLQLQLQCGWCTMTDGEQPKQLVHNGTGEQALSKQWVSGFLGFWILGWLLEIALLPVRNAPGLALGGRMACAKQAQARTATLQRKGPSGTGVAALGAWGLGAWERGLALLAREARDSKLEVLDTLDTAVAW